MNDLLYIGQWQGFYTYGPEYGEIVAGKEAEFRLFIEEYGDNQFSGKCIDWEGIGADGEFSKVTGFIKGDFISFTKEYPHYYVMDEWGNSSIEPDLAGHTVVYEGRFEPHLNSFVGTWEINIAIDHIGELTIEEVLTGTWRMKRQM